MVEGARGALRRRAKIVATLGPATDDPQVLTQMMRAGLDVVRLNASHGTVEDRRRRLAQVREAAQRADRCVGVLLDLAGPKIRIECFREGSVQLAEGAPFTLDTALEPKGGTAEAVGVAYKNLPQDVRAGDTLLLNDGQIVLDVVRVAGTAIEKYGVEDGISYISTGGGAFLEFVEGKTLPAVAMLEQRARG